MEQKKKTKNDKISTAFFVIIIVCALIFKFTCCPVLVDGASMSPTYHSGQILFSSRVTDNTVLNRGDVIVFRTPEHSSYIKRIMALPGDTIQVTTAGIYVNGELYGNEYGVPKDCGDYTEPYTLTDDEYFVMGDNRPDSYDSRFFGPIKRDVIKFKI